MSKLTFDEAIQLYIQRAENHEYILHSGEFIGGEGERMKQDIKRCVSENRQLAEWLTELKELRDSLGAVKLKDMKEAVGLLQELNAENDQITSQLLEAKRLLKSAVNDIKDVADNGSCNHCIFNSMYAQGSCCMDGCYKWRYADEALALIGEDGDTNG